MYYLLIHKLPSYGQVCRGWALQIIYLEECLYVLHWSPTSCVIVIPKVSHT